MTQLAAWLQAQMHQRGYTQTAVHAPAAPQWGARARGGIAQGTLSDILNKDHIPRIKALFRLADHFDTSRLHILQIAGHLTPADQLPRDHKPQPVLSEAEGPDSRDYLIDELLHQFHQIPDQWKPEVIAQARMFVRLANHPSVRIIGDDPEPEPTDAQKQEEQPSAQQPEHTSAQVA